MEVGPELSRQQVIALGTLTTDNQLFGEWKCRVIADLDVWNETEKGLASVERWEPFGCSAKGCSGGGTLTPEEGPKLEEKLNAKKEIEYRAIRREPSFPWPGELLSEMGTRLKIRKMELVFDCPGGNVEEAYTGTLEPLVVNGLANGLSPSHLAFEGKAGSIEALCPVALPCEEPTELHVSGEFTILGTREQLITAE